MVFSTLFYENHKKEYPDSLIYIIAPFTMKTFVENNFPGETKLVPFPTSGFRLNLMTEWRFFKALYIENFDAYYCVIDYMCPTRIPHNLLGSIVGYTAGIPLCYGLYRQHNKDLLPIEKKLVHYVFEEKSLYTKHGFISHGEHLSTAPLKLLNFIGIKPVHPDYRLYPDPSQDDLVEGLLSQFVHPDDLIVLVNPTTNMQFKQWSFKRFAALADRLIETFGVKVIVNGSRDEKIGQYLKLLMNHSFIDLSGKNALTLSQLVTVAHKSHVCIGLDSGPTHIAIAVSTPTIILFCSSPASMSGPLDDRLHRVVETPVRPCGTYCFSQPCWMDTPCREFISVDNVYEAFADIVANHYPEKMPA